MENEQEGVLDLTGALADPTRLSLYQDLVSADRPLTVKEFAERFSLHPNVIRTHLQKLVDVGLVETKTRRSGAGGRPAKMYSPSENVSTLQFPPRDYRLLADVLLRFLSNGASGGKGSLESTGMEAGRTLARETLDRAPRRITEDPSERLDDLLHIVSSLNLQPELSTEESGESRIKIRNCVFNELVKDYSELVCPLHTALLRGVVEEYFPDCEIDAQTGPEAKREHCSLIIRGAN